MFERFTRTARAVVTDAVDAAEQRRDRHVGTEHLLIGLARSQAPVVVAALGECGLDAEAVRVALADVEKSALAAVGITVEADPMVEGDSPRAGRAPRVRHRPFTDGAKQVLEGALGEAQDLRSRRLGAEHVLLALAARPAHDPGVRLLQRLGAAPEDLRQAALARLRTAPPT